MPNCQSCGRPVTNAEYYTQPVGFCRVCRRAVIAQQGMPRPCLRCGRIFPAAEINKNNGYCNTCAALQQIEALPPAGPVGPRGWIHCPHCDRDVNLRAIQPNNKCTCGYVLHPTICPNPRCNQIIDKNAPSCNRCGWENPNFVDTRVSLTKSMSKRIKNKIYETVVFELIGVFLALGLPFLGLPSMIWLAIVFMAFLPFYNFLPSESEAKASRQKGVESLGWEAGSLLLLKGMVKTIMFVFSVIQFIVLPVSKLIPLAISFAYYFTLPTSYKTTQPFRMIEAWFRVGVGALIAWFMLLAFSGTPQAWSLFLMSLAFFCTSFPKHKEAEPHEAGEVRVDVNVIPVVGGTIRNLRENVGGYLDSILNILFLFIMLFSLGFSQIGSSQLTFALTITAIVAMFLLLMRLSVNTVIGVYVVFTLIAMVITGAFTGNMFQIIFFAVWLLCVITGLAAGREGRPAAGILMIFMTLFVFSFTATGVIGEAVFGYWWPQIYAFGESIAAPLGPLWEQATSGISDTWLLLTNPMAYYDQMMKKQQATKSVVKEGGTTKSIEITRTDLFTSVTGELEPRLDPLIGSFEIQNQGEYDASRIDLVLWASWQDTSKVTAENPLAGLVQLIGTLSKFECSQPSFSNIETVSPGTKGVCNWTKTTYPKEMKFVNFVYEKNSWSLGTEGNLADCVVKDVEGKEICKDSGDCCNNPNAAYVHSKQTVKVNVNLTYDYNVNVSIPVEVIDQEKYRNLLQAKQITLQELTSQYTGGPVKATLWSQKQPIRDNGETSLFVASIVNEGGGTINKINSFEILIPTDLVNSNENIEIVAQTFQEQANSFNGCGTEKHPTESKTIGKNEYWVISCVHNIPMKTGEYKRVSFFITPKDVSDRKTSLIIGLANYEYTKTGSASIAVANAPWH